MAEREAASTVRDSETADLEDLTNHAFLNKGFSTHTRICLAEEFRYNKGLGSHNSDMPGEVHECKSA